MENIWTIESNIYRKHKLDIFLGIAILLLVKIKKLNTVNMAAAYDFGI